MIEEGLVTHPLSAQEMQFDVSHDRHDSEGNAFLCPNPDEGQAAFCMIEGTCQSGKCVGEEFKG